MRSPLQSFTLQSFTLLASCLLGLTLVSNASAQSGGGPGETLLPDTVAVFPFTPSNDYARLNVMINGMGPFPMIFDTGAGVTVLNKDFAKELGLEVLGQSRIGDPTNPQAIAVDQLMIEELNFGDAYFYDMEAVAWERPQGMGNKLGRGVLGLPTFLDCVFTIDYGKNELRVEYGELPPANGRDIIELGKGFYPIIAFQVEIKGKSYEAILDSGNPGTTMLPISLMDELDIVEGSTHEGTGRLANSTMTLITARIENKLKVGGFELSNPLVSFSSTLKDINLGRHFLNQFAVTVDMANRRMQLRPHDQKQARAQATSGSHKKATGAKKPEDLLHNMLGDFEIEARLWRTMDAKPQVLQGKASFAYSHGGKHVHEAFELENPGGHGILKGDAYLSWRPAAKRFELTQIDSFSPRTLWLTGEWDAKRERLALRSTPAARGSSSELRWEYRFEENGTFVKEMLVKGKDGEFRLMSDYRYRAVED